MNTTVRRTGLLLGSLALLAGHTPAAQAATWRGTDPSGDVEVTTCTDPADDTTCTSGLASSVSDGDVVATTVTHGDGKVVIKTRHRALTSKLNRMFMAYIVTNEGVKRYVFAMASVGKAQPSAVIMMRGNGSTVSCGSLAARVDTTTKTAILRVGRGCLSNPRWVKVAQATNESSSDETINRWDESFRKGPMVDYAVFSAQVRNN